MKSATEQLRDMPSARCAGRRPGITSVCSAHPVVIKAALHHGLARGGPVLIEATCNQVNQDGGYTGMAPDGFRRFVEDIAAAVGFPPERLLLGGDHLGPNPWAALPAQEAMGRAVAMIEAYAAAGFTKLHLDASMSCADDPVPLPDEVIAARAAELAATAEMAVRKAGGEPPVYIIGTEVPVPGGAFEAMDHLHVTTPEDALRTAEIHRKAFRARGLEAAFERTIGMVVQPGVEFGNTDVIEYEPRKAAGLSTALRQMPQFVFEAHSTDYQSAIALRHLVSDGFAILKVGPWLTFALREALYGLDCIARIIAPDKRREDLPASMDELMTASPGYWKKYYPGAAADQYFQRHFSYSDRIR
ncbi:class II D-tagatose-bisphosphate aldolase, non-catalytic subunit, partial [Rhizobium sp. TRM95111]|uniref:class II D-tagatose-bisphosphate aldolase, non-catalytic subunit n=1 Tax=Rhizobium alarense TaxID=2846851 RepID=UPI001F1FFDBD